MAWDSRLATGALNGVEALKSEWASVPKLIKPELVNRLDTIHKPNAAKAEKAPA